MAEIVSRIYNNFRGVDFRGEEINLTRSPDSLNVWKDYKETESIRTRPGMAKIYHTDFPVRGLFAFKDEIIFHYGPWMRTTNGKQISASMCDSETQTFVNGEWLYIKEAMNYYRYDGTTFEVVKGYVPTTTIGRKPAGGGTVYEDVNMLSSHRINSFVGDGKSSTYHLDAMEIDENFVPIVKVFGEVVGQETYTVDYQAGTVTFTEHPPGAPLTAGQDNVTIEFQKTVPWHREAILGCRLVEVFDNRVFFSGYKDKPNVVWHSSLNDPTYISDLDYYQEGMDNAAVTGLVAGNNALWVFREPSDGNTTIFYHQPTIDSEYGKIYPSVHSSVATGCVGGAINFNDDIVFFSDRGMEGISGDVTTEQVLAHRSSLVDRRLLAEEGYKDMILAEWEGYLLVIMGRKVYLADSRGMFTNGTHNEYEWFYWELEKTVSCAMVHDGVLYLGCEDGIYTLTDRQSSVKSWWVTPKDKFNNPHKLKTTNKRGCVAESTGDICVYAKLEDTDFELIGEYKSVTDYFVSRIKRKKFKDIQLKFQTDTRFSLETVTLECFIGGYVKR